MKVKIKGILKSRIVTLLGILLFIAVCIGTGSLLAYIEHESDPTEQAVIYFRAFIQQDYETMYECIDRENGYYVNKDLYISQMKQVRQNMVIDTYEIKEPEKENGKIVVAIECTDTDADTTQEMKIYLNKKRKGLQIVPDYSINVDLMMVDNFSVVISEGNSLELNGEEITDNMADITTDKEGNITYNFDAAINGQYNVSATNDYYAVTQEIHLTEKDTKVDLTGENYTANEKYTQLLTDHGEQLIKQFYRAVRNRRPSYKKLIANCEENNRLIKKMQKLVERSEEVVYWPETRNIENYNVIEMKMSTLKNTIKYDPDTKQYIVTYRYNYRYTSSTDTALYTSYVDTFSGRCRTTMTLTYSLENDNVVLSDISIKNRNNKK